MLNLLLAEKVCGKIDASANVALFNALLIRIKVGVFQLAGVIASQRGAKSVSGDVWMLNHHNWLYKYFISSIFIEDVEYIFTPCTIMMGCSLRWYTLS